MEWENTFDSLHNNGWSLGYVSYTYQKKLIWLADGHKSGFHIKAEGNDLNEAFSNLNNLLETIKN